METFLIPEAQRETRIYRFRPIILVFSPLKCMFVPPCTWKNGNNLFDLSGRNELAHRIILWIKERRELSVGKHATNDKKLRINARLLVIVVFNHIAVTSTVWPHLSSCRSNHCRVHRLYNRDFISDLVGQHSETHRSRKQKKSSSIWLMYLEHRPVLW